MFDFQDVVGQEAVKEHFRTAITSDRVSHAYMLIGEAGLGKNALADAFSRMLLCERDPLHPCGVCHACKQVMAGTHPDVIHVTHEKPNIIKVDEIRDQLDAEIGIRPFSGKRRVFIIPDADKMNAQAQNAALKTIEEPPSYAVILLLCDREDSLLETIRSRCVKLRLRPVPDRELLSWLRGMEGVTEEQAELAAGFARGNAGKARQMALSDTFRERCAADLKLLTGLPESGTEQLLAGIDRVREDYPDPGPFLDFVRMYCRDLLVLKKRGRREDLIFPEWEKELTRAAVQTTLPGIGRILEETERTEERFRANVNPELAIELLLLTVRQSTGKGK
ncbi:MAG: DNA polymerase III subunit delta' [Lachnospiraceae bacterium]|nr:DNA polymerase III subunit delta' [Lachnospiraceae bacterium]